MAESRTTDATGGHKTIYLKDYKKPHYSIDQTDLHFDLFDDHTIVNSRLRLHRHPDAPNHDLLLHGDNLILEKLQLDGKTLTKSDYELTKDFLILRNTPPEFELQIQVKIFPQKNTAYNGLYYANSAFCTQCEAEGFRRITFYLDQPDVLSLFTTTITADKNKYPTLLSNGNLIDSGEGENNRHWVKWQDPFRKPSYLFALVGGDFDLVEDFFTTQSGRCVTLKIYVEKGYGDQVDHGMYALKEAMRWDEENYGREYDLDSYLIVAMGSFNMGAMENKGLNVFNTKNLLAKPATATDKDYIHILATVGHEYFHNWTGNRVTCRDWFQLSIKEGLTIFRDQSFTADLVSPAAMRISDVNYLRDFQFPEDASPLAHPVCPDSYIEINNFYTTTIYNKGAEILRMLQTLLGKKVFRQAMDLYFDKYDGKAVTIEDYIQVMEEASGINLKQFRLWYSQPGTPVLNVTDDYNPSTQTYTLTITQGYGANSLLTNYQPLLIPVLAGLLDSKGNAMPLHVEGRAPQEEILLQVTKASQTFKFTQVTSAPVPSLLRNFSSPIKLNYAYSDQHLELLCKFDKDPFTRWEAAQQYVLRVLLSLIKDYHQDQPLQAPSSLIEMFKYIINKGAEDKFLLAEMLLLPSEKYIGEQMEVVDVEGIHAAREFLLLTLAKNLEKDFLKLYEQNYQKEDLYQFTAPEIAKRYLKNYALSYLMLLPQYQDIGIIQFNAALTKNMTDTQSSLRAITNIDSPARMKCLDTFYQQWQGDALVVDKWFALQASTKLPIALAEVKRLVRHEAFDLKNPNKVYALIGSFGRNSINFHNINGEGYAFLREVVSQLDGLNPQVASRMIRPLAEWRRYDEERQQLMKRQLLTLADEKNISVDLYEVISKSLKSEA